MASKHLRRYFATSAKGIEPVTAAELARLGAEKISPTRGGVYFEGDLAVLYRANLWLRTATRILCPLREFSASTPEMLYSQARRVHWEEFLNPHKTLAVHATIQAKGGRAADKSVPKAPAARGRRTKAKPPAARGKATGKGARDSITHSQYAALKIKDAIVDRLRLEQGARPNVDRENPDILVHAHFSGTRCTLSLDSSGTSLHERGYRVQAAAAPLKETLAAAIVELTGWQGDRPFFDPMCGSGTLVIEAALKALRIAPGLLRASFAFQRWPDFDRALWSEIEQSARAQVLSGAPAMIFGSDSDPQAVQAAQANARRAGVGHAVRFSVQRAEEASPPVNRPGVVVVNPPYGERLGNEAELESLYHGLGEVWRERFGGWETFVFAGNLTLARKIGLHAVQKTRLYNGPLECRLLKFEIEGD